MTLTISVAEHPRARISAFDTRWEGTCDDAALARVRAALQPGAVAPVQGDERVRGAVRDLLRVGGWKPSGRGKPASEYLRKALAEGGIPHIHPLVDACNATSLHSGIPISVIDLDRARTPLHVAVAGPDDTYVFNAAGQTITLTGLLCLFDATGPCANAVRDAQRTKADASTRRTLSILWGERSLATHLDAAQAWYRTLLADLGATTTLVEVSHGAAVEAGLTLP
jgi:DNA/RNA-binding domain of Phe-tRNA-synthetase-like protein